MSAGVALAGPRGQQMAGHLNDTAACSSSSERRHVHPAVRRIVTSRRHLPRPGARGGARSGIYAAPSTRRPSARTKWPGTTPARQHLGYLTGERHSHLDSADTRSTKGAQKSETLEPSKTATTCSKRALAQVLTSLVVSLFAQDCTRKTRCCARRERGNQRTSEDLARLGAKPCT